MLVILTVLLIAIWWDNLKLFNQSESKYVLPIENQIAIQDVRSDKKEILAFKPPRVNPFLKSEFMEEKSTQTQNREFAVVKIEKPSSRHRLLGVIKDKKKPQAVINSSEGNTAVLSISDSLVNWVLIRVDTNLIVFKNDKLYDTLWLETVSSVD